MIGLHVFFHVAPPIFVGVLLWTVGALNPYMNVLVPTGVEALVLIQPVWSSRT